MTTSDLPSGGSYRDSHLQKGTGYDRELLESPLNAFFHREEVQILNRVLDRTFPAGVGTYLDFACGTGRITAVVEPRARISHGVDVSASMIRTARRKCPCTKFHMGDITRDRFLVPGPYDLATAFRFFGNAEEELRLEALEALSRRVRPGGVLVLTHHRNPRCLHALFQGIRGEAPSMDLTHARLASHLRRFGFRPVRCYGIGAWLLRARWMTPRILSGRISRVLEPVSRPLSPLAPNAVIVARRV